ncbi:hypothetical protein J6590_045345 [Homalodisca vitripennis]|nr:hypothetical protein J6590_045345 [Homalodisca vitripennis]
MSAHLEPLEVAILELPLTTTEATTAFQFQCGDSVVDGDIGDFAGFSLVTPRRTWTDARVEKISPLFGYRDNPVSKICARTINPPTQTVLCRVIGILNGSNR